MEGALKGWQHGAMRVRALIATACIVAAAGCSSNDRPEKAAKEPSTTTTTHAYVEDPSVNRARFASQNDMHVTTEGFRPETMVALIDEPIDIVNNTPAPLVVRFTNYTTPDGRAETPPIAPGERFTWKATSGHSIVMTADGLPGQGAIVVEPDALKLEGDVGGTDQPDGEPRPESAK